MRYLFAALLLITTVSNAEVVRQHTLLSVIANSEAFDGKQIAVRGFLCRLGGNNSRNFGIFIDKTDCNNEYYDKGLRVFLNRKQAKAATDSFYIIYGKYSDQTKYVTTDNFITGFIEVEKIE